MNTHIHTNEGQTSLEFSKVIGRAYERFTKVVFPILALLVITILGTLALGLLVAAISFGLYTLFPNSFMALAVIAFVIIAALAFLLYCYLGVGVMQARLLENPTFDFLPLFKKSLKESIRVYTITLGSSLAILGGLVLFIVPGIWLAVLFSFVMYAALFENKGFKDALATSIRLVKGHFWTVVSFVLFLGLTNVVINLIPFLSVVLSILFGIFASVLMYEVYKTLHNVKNVNEITHKEEKNIIFFAKLCIVIALIGLVLLSVLVPVVLLGSSMQ